MKNFLALLICILIVSCVKEKHDFTLKGYVKGLKKGTVYLQKQQDSLIVSIDSLEITGNSNFELHTDLAEPEILFLRLDKNDLDEGVVVFFADKGVTEINSTLKNFNFDAKVNGSKQQKVLEDYLLVMSKFNDQNLELIKEEFDARKENDSAGITNLENNYNNLIKRKYLYTINFAVNNKDSEVAPYLALSEIPNTSIKYLETIYDALDETIKASKYGKLLNETIQLRKEE